MVVRYPIGMKRATHALRKDATVAPGAWRGLPIAPSFSAMSASCPQLGFEVTLHLDIIDAAASTALRNAFTSMLDSRGLSSDGGAAPRPDWLRHVIWREGSQAEHADREAVRGPRRREIISAAIGDLIDIDIPGQFEPRR